MATCTNNNDCTHCEYEYVCIYSTSKGVYVNER